MKKFVLPLAIAGFSFTLFSFSTSENRTANFNEMKKSDMKMAYTVGSFTKMQTNHYTGDRGTWNDRMQTWSLTDDNGSLDQIENALK